MFIQLCRCIRQFKPHIVHTQLFYSDIFGRIASWVCRIPVLITTVQSSVHEPTTKFYYSRSRRLIDALTMPLCSHIIAVSNYVKHSIQRRLFVRGVRISVIPNSAPATRATPLFRNKIKPLLLCSVGKLNPAKGQRELIQSMRMLLDRGYDLPVLLAGDGPSRRQFEFEAIRQGVRRNVLFMGNIDTVSRLLASADAFVFPSHSEGLPFALIESVLAQKPCIVSAIPSNLEVIRPSNCFTFSPNNPESLSRALLRYLALRDANPKKLQRMVRRAYVEALRKFDPKKNAKLLGTLYHTLIARSVSHAH